MSAWLFRVMQYVSSNLLRSETRRKSREAAAAHSADASAESSDIAWNEIRRNEHEAVADLRSADRKAILLRFYQQLSWEEIGPMLGISVLVGAYASSRDFKLSIAQDIASPLRTRCLAGDDFKTHIRSRWFQKSSRQSSMKLRKYNETARKVIRAMYSRNRIFISGGLSAAAIIAATIAIYSRFAHPAQPQAVCSQPTMKKTIVGESATRPANISAADLITGIKKAESQFQNIYIKNFDTTSEILKDGETQWKPYANAYAGSAWFDNHSHGKMRLFLRRKSWSVDLPSVQFFSRS